MARYMTNGRNEGMRAAIQALSVGFRMGKLINLERRCLFSQSVALKISWFGILLLESPTGLEGL